LKADLLRLAALLHVEVLEKDKVEDLKAKIRPVMAVLKDVKPAAALTAPASSGSTTTFSNPLSRPMPTTSNSLPLPSAAPAP